MGVDWDSNPEPTLKVFGAALPIERSTQLLVQKMDRHLRVLLGLELSLKHTSQFHPKSEKWVDRDSNPEQTP